MFNSTSVGMSILGAAFSIGSDVCVRPNKLAFHGGHVFSARKRRNDVDNCLRCRRFGGLRCHFGFGIGSVLIVGAGRSPSCPFCNAICNAKGTAVTNGTRSNIGVSITVAAGHGAAFACVGSGMSATIDGRFVGFISGAPHHTMRSSIHLSSCRVTRGRVRRRGRDSASVQLGLLMSTAPSTAVGVVVSPVTNSCVDKQKAKGVHARFFGGKSMGVFNDCQVDRKICGFDLRRIVQGSFVVESKDAVAFGNSPLSTALSVGTNCAIGSTSLGSLVPGRTASNCVDRAGMGIGYVVSLAKRLASPSMGFSVRLPGRHSRIRTVIHGCVPASRRVGVRVLCLLTVNGFCAPRGLKTARGSGVVSDIISSALSKRLGGTLSGVLSIGG